MAEASRVIILDGKKILFIHRLRNDEEFFVPPGGSIEDGETPQEAAIREAKEETNLDVIIDKPLFNIVAANEGRHKRCYFFLAKKFSGDIKLIGPELEKVSPTNTFSHEWVSIDELDDKTIYPLGLKELLKKFLGS